MAYNSAPENITLVWHTSDVSMLQTSRRRILDEGLGQEEIIHNLVSTEQISELQFINTMRAIVDRALENPEFHYQYTRLDNSKYVGDNKNNASFSRRNPIKHMQLAGFSFVENINGDRLDD